MAAPAAKTRVEREVALPLAREFVDVIRPACERVEIAGSLRRYMPLVADIEVLAIPRRHEGEPERDMFDQPIGPIPIVSDLDLLLSDLAEDGRLGMRLDKLKRPAWGDRYKRALWRAFPLDLFICLPPAQWGVLMAIRTGPHEFSKQLVAQRGTKTPDGRPGLLSPVCKVQDAQLWRGPISLPIPEEVDFFREAGVEFVEPHQRR